MSAVSQFETQSKLKRQFVFLGFLTLMFCNALLPLFVFGQDEITVKDTFTDQSNWANHLESFAPLEFGPGAKFNTLLIIAFQSNASGVLRELTIPTYFHSVGHPVNDPTADIDLGIKLFFSVEELFSNPESAGLIIQSPENPDWSEVPLNQVAGANIYGISWNLTPLRLSVNKGEIYYLAIEVKAGTWSILEAPTFVLASNPDNSAIQINPLEDFGYSPQFGEEPHLLSDFDILADQAAILLTASENTILGDVNQDGVVNLLDVAPFVEVLTNGEFQAEADINQDGVVDLLDVAPFVDILSGG